MSPLKVFVADANSTDGTREAALAFRDTFDISIIPGGLPAVGRNAGARMAGSKYVLFLDADVELADPTLLERALAMMKTRRLECLTTNIACLDGTFFDRLLYKTNNFMQYLASFTVPFGSGMFILFDREAFERLGGFNEAALFAEDYLLTKKVPVRRFGILRGQVMTSARRMRKTGRSRIVWLFVKTMLNSANPSYFLKDQDYWAAEK